MRNKILKSKHLHITFDHIVHELYSEDFISAPEDFNNENGIACEGIWDTGSEGCLISADLANKLNLPIVGYKNVIGVNGERRSPEYLLNLFLSNGASFEVIMALVGELISDNEVLIGMDIINQGDFAVTNVNSKTALSFRVPTIQRINFELEYQNALKEETEVKRKQRKDTKGSQKSRKRRRFR